MQRFEETLEVEFKFIPWAPESTVVSHIAHLFSPEYGFAKWPPCANFDIYLDTPDLLLYQGNTPLRLRRWATPFKMKKGISANFKYPPEGGTGLRRRELKTILSQAEAREICSGAIIGESLEHAAKLVGQQAHGPVRFRPDVMITTHQTLYVLRQRAQGQDGTLRRGKLSDLLLLTFERCSIQAVPPEAAQRLLRSGMLDLRPDFKTAELFEAELEIIAAEDHADVATELYTRVFHEICRTGTEIPTRSKYSAAVEALRGGCT
jgi:hypothetical protein